MEIQASWAICLLTMTVYSNSLSATVERTHLVLRLKKLVAYEMRDHLLVIAKRKRHR